jgi:hypothetical protein
MDGFSLITDHNLLLQSRGMFDRGTHASMLAADGYDGVANYSSDINIVRTEDQQKNNEKDLVFCDLPELGEFDGFGTNMRLNPCHPEHVAFPSAMPPFCFPFTVFSPLFYFSIFDIFPFLF